MDQLIKKLLLMGLLALNSYAAVNLKCDSPQSQVNAGGVAYQAVCVDYETMARAIGIPDNGIGKILRIMVRTNRTDVVGIRIVYTDNTGAEISSSLHLFNREVNGFNVTGGSVRHANTGNINAKITLLVELP